MRKLLWLLPLLGLACSAVPDPEVHAPAPGGSPPDVRAVAAGPIRLAVPDAVMLALEKNPDLGIGAARILAARAGVEEARSAWYPSFGLSLGYTHSNDPVFVFMQTLRQRDLTFGGDFNEPGGHGNARLSAGFDWLVWDGGRRQAGEDLARLQVNLTEDARAAVENELKAAVIRTCLAVFEAEEFIHVSEESVRLVEQQLSVAKARFAAGAAQRSDMLSVEVRQAEAKEGLVLARNSRKRGLASLRSLLGLTAAEPFTLEGRGGFHVPPVEETEHMAVARANRPEIRRAESAVVAARRGVDLAEAGRMPTVSAFGSYDLDDEHGVFTQKQDSVTGGVRVDLNVFEGYRSSARIAAAKARVTEAGEAARKTLLVVEADVTRAELALGEARERLAVSLKSEAQAEEALHLIGARYENGAATITEFLDAEVALTGARVRNVAGRYLVERATADLRRALGICRASLDASVRSQDTEGGR